MLLTAMLIATTAQAGPISKFSERAPAQDFVSSRKLEDVERCLIDMKGWLVPNVYRQPDRPDAVTIIWTGVNGLAGGRVDLARQASGTKLTAWMPAKQIADCAPR